MWCGQDHSKGRKVLRSIMFLRNHQRRYFMIMVVDRAEIKQISWRMIGISFRNFQHRIKGRVMEEQEKHLKLAIMMVHLDKI